MPSTSLLLYFQVTYLCKRSIESWKTSKVLCDNDDNHVTRFCSDEFLMENNSANSNLQVFKRPSCV